MVRCGKAMGRALAGQRRALVFLEGELGAGKTTLCRGILAALGHNGAVKSPTYTLVEPYDLGKYRLYHFDLYRMSDPEELEYMGIRDYLEDEQSARGNYCVVEWPERGTGILPAADIAVRIAVAGNGRRLLLESCTPIGDNLLAALDISRGQESQGE